MDLISSIVIIHVAESSQAVNKRQVPFIFFYYLFFW